mgnify:CR=1 FL=1
MSQKHNIQKKMQAQTEPTQPQLAPVAVLTITFLPPTNQVANIQAVFPAQIDPNAALHILRRAEESLIARLTAPAQTDVEHAGK